MKDMESGKLAYNDDNVTWNGKKYKRKNGKIMYNGKALIEGHPSLPWEKVAYAAEPSESAQGSECGSTSAPPTPPDVPQCAGCGRH